MKGVDKMEWIMDNLGTIIVSTILVLTVFIAIMKLLHDRKNGKTCGNCGNCAMAGTCHKQKNNKQSHG